MSSGAPFGECVIVLIQTMGTLIVSILLDLAKGVLS